MTRFAWIMLGCAACLGAGLSAVFPPMPRLIWNVSASMPIGLYAAHPADTLHVAELVVVMPPPALATFLDDRRYLPKGVPLLKRVVALQGARVCRIGRVVSVDGMAMGVALDRDRAGRALPNWQGCRMLAPDEVFLMNRARPDSLDGRYFGALPTTSVVARAEPLWTKPEH